MKEVVERRTVLKEQLQAREVLLWLDDEEYEATGDWDWDLSSDTVFCSNVMVSLPGSFEGTRSLIHPDDVPQVREAVRKGEAPLRLLQFRIITSYGEIKTLTGKAVRFSEATFIAPLLVPQREAAAPIVAEDNTIARRLQAASLAEKTTATGTWWMNTTTGEVQYSDGMFHLYLLAPQSLNSHPFTFVPFLHPCIGQLIR